MPVKAINDNDAKSIFATGVCCSMAVLGELAEDAGISRDEAWRISGCFCGGMGMNGACGAVSGAYMALGLVHGGREEEKRAFLKEKKKEFDRRFAAELGGLTCLEILEGLKNNDPVDQEEIARRGLKQTRCPHAVAAAVNIASELMQKE